ncbi:hypothetical protein [Nonomuraea roseola]|uniref:Uncharacterized protein n=1 Tax=Nonomuraea roseola TaxID=46179 RepID=A0ABV5Q2R0_9ACTN
METSLSMTIPNSTGGWTLQEAVNALKARGLTRLLEIDDIDDEFRGFVLDVRKGETPTTGGTLAAYYLVAIEALDDEYFAEDSTMTAHQYGARKAAITKVVFRKTATSGKPARPVAPVAVVEAAPVEAPAAVQWRDAAPAVEAPAPATFTTEDVTLTAFRNVLRPRAEFAEAVHGKGSTEHSVIMNIGFQMADELYGRGAIDDRKAFLRWLFLDA